MDIEVTWLAGKPKSKARATVLERIDDGAPMVIGTHALFQDEVKFERPVLTIINEQHRSGVQRRLALRQKGANDKLCPRQLVMTTAPTPWTLAMSVYADLDTSILDELPPGCILVNTMLTADNRCIEVIEQVRTACREGRRVYWVYALTGESEELTCQTTETTYEEFSSALDELRVGLTHGRTKPVDEAVTMETFKEGMLQLLVATTAIKIDVDTPNASLMIIENPECLSLVRLHQLHGRIGRGSVASHCALLYYPPLPQVGHERLDIMHETSDGLIITEKDLELRGSGEMLSIRQTGLLQFKAADLMHDVGLLPAVHDAVQSLLAHRSQYVSPLPER